jgi:hypothetical protein
MLHKYDEIVKPLQWLQAAGFKTAIIAGGCLRDLYHQRYPRDVDIFLWDPELSNETTPFAELVANKKENPGHVWRTGHAADRIWIDLMRLEDFDVIEQKFDDYHEQKGKITAVWDIWKSDINFQLIFTKTPPLEHLNNNFNIGLCKVYCDGTKVRFTGDFMKDASNKTLTICAKNMTEQEYEFTINQHIPRLKKKYNYKVVHTSDTEKFKRDKLTVSRS